MHLNANLEVCIIKEHFSPLTVLSLLPVPQTLVLTVHCQIFQSCTGEHMKSKPSLHELWLHVYFYLQILTAGYQELSERVTRIPFLQLIQEKRKK